MFTKLSNRELACALIPTELKRYEQDKQSDMQVRLAIADDTPFTISFGDLEEMIAKAREVGNKEQAGTLNDRRYLHSLRLAPLVKPEFILEHTKEFKDEYVERWLSL